MGILQFILIAVWAAFMETPMTAAGLASLATPWVWISAFGFVVILIAIIDTVRKSDSEAIALGFLTYVIVFRLVNLVTAISMAVLINQEGSPILIGILLVVNVLSMLGTLFTL